MASLQPFTLQQTLGVSPTTGESLSTLVERLYGVRQRLKELEATEKELTQAITTQMQQRSLKAVVSPKVEAKLTPNDRLTVDPGKLERLLPHDAFLSCVSVVVSKAEELVGRKRLEEIGAITPGWRLKVQERKASVNGNGHLSVGARVQRAGDPQKTGTLVCVSGEWLSVRWDSGRIEPCHQANLEKIA